MDSPGLLQGPIAHIKNRGPRSPTGTAAAECLGDEEQPAWEAPAAQISQRVPSPQGLGRLAKKPEASDVMRLEIERVKGEEGKGLGRHLSAADQLRRVSYLPGLG